MFTMDFLTKAFLGGLAVLAACWVLILLNALNNTIVLLLAGLWFLWLSFHNRITKTIAVSAVIGLLGAFALGGAIGLLLFALVLTAFWFAWI